MIQKNSIIKPADNSGVLKANVFHIYKNKQPNFGFVGDFIRISAREVLPENSIKKKSKHKSILIRSTYKIKKKDGCVIFFKKNALILLKKRLTPRGKILKGPVSRIIKRKKFLSSFKKSI